MVDNIEKYGKKIETPEEMIKMLDMLDKDHKKWQKENDDIIKEKENEIIEYIEAGYKPQAIAQTLEVSCIRLLHWRRKYIIEKRNSREYKANIKNKHDSKLITRILDLKSTGLGQIQIAEKLHKPLNQLSTFIRKHSVYTDREKEKLDKIKSINIEKLEPGFKRCRKCLEVKDVNAFCKSLTNKDGCNTYCRICTSGEQKKYMRTAMAKVKARQRSKKYTQQGKTAAYLRKRRREDLKYRINDIISSAIRLSLRKRGTKKNRQKWETLVGYNVCDLIKHLESLFRDGMSWDNYGEWHIDHIIPISRFNYKSYKDIDIRRCWALNNLQPLWAIDNLKKSDNIKESFQAFLQLEVL